ncbi:MAG: NAD(P)H-dependent oxidoreductase [Nitrosopumilus sp.]|nr:NAD(P)H-dependent oxidoreductase [Nitrosopumilus sp.]MDH3490168.1 NAD(P)H-dependent oxidoreductase [Nitrosopumilus sp.]MDH3516907.1 NAD(P)H-dependent oxidoreductase [Nitrosopumilus sp.]MDH3565282.1 NAD(P)H-dependent oxidoreductase [Nitrosopumilus sp.]MDH5416662.1 NAD(P)H-dependent oxidoreductase [Nitrosopumilus sp.]
MGLKILGVASSMRESSYSTYVLKLTLEKAERESAETKLLDLRETQLPMYHPEQNSSPELNKVTEYVKWADAFILASPDYHGSMSGVMKNFLDFFWSDFAGKTFGYICASHEKGLTVMDQMRTAVRQCYGWSMPYGVSVNSDQDFDKQGKITNKNILSRIETMSRDLIVYGSLIADQYKKDLQSKESNTFAARYRP